MRHISKDGVELIKLYEGFRGKPYRCAGGYITIGYGHVIKQSESFRAPISIGQAEALLRKDVMLAQAMVLRYIDVPLENFQYDALVSFTFNLGAGALQRSTLRRKVNQERHIQVPDEFMRWVYAGGRKLAGLVKRRSAEAMLYQGGYKI